ncbi:unnamed protein product [Durusdinium trenchii]|uniref:Uncharacterized protein n=1 Tax=Durusdinium trenchii TaxID=1381693 RepID=A0ABP0LJB4_9DINO
MGSAFSGASSYTAPAEIPTRWFPDFEQELPSLQGKVFCVTGCTSGTGLVAATTAAKKGAHVVMLNRQSDRAVAAEKALREQVPGAEAGPTWPGRGAVALAAQIVAQWSKQELLQSPLEKTRGPIQISTVEKRPEEFESALEAFEEELMDPDEHGSPASLLTWKREFFTEYCQEDDWASKRKKSLKAKMGSSAKDVRAVRFTFLTRLDDGDVVREHEVESPDNADFLISFFAAVGDQIPTNTELKDCSWILF